MMAVNLIETYGLVPQTVYPESWNSSHSGEVDTFLASKLREYAVELRTHLLDLRKTLKRKTALRGARELKNEQVSGAQGSSLRRRRRRDHADSSRASPPQIADERSLQISRYLCRNASSA
jgi:Mg-chelatase subunit ChlI